MDKQSPIPTYVLAELTSLDDLSFPTSSSKRIKFTCLDSSPRYLILGTSSGAGYVFSRFRQKKSPTNIPPVDVFVTRDGSVNTVCISPLEKFIAVGSDSGRVTVLSLTACEQKFSVFYSFPGDVRKPNKITALRWSDDATHLFVGHANGVVHNHKINSKPVFRSSYDVLCSLGSEIVQFDTTDDCLLVSTLESSHVFCFKNSSLCQVGKKLRNAKMGACFLRSTDVSSYKGNCTIYVAAARPNGRIWESNTAGVVYRTHQMRLSPDLPRCSVASFRTQFRFQENEDGELETAMNADINFSLLYPVNCEKHNFVVSFYGSSIFVFDPEHSKMILNTNIDEEIRALSVSGLDVFVLITGSSFLRKYSLLTLPTAVDRLRIKKCFSQIADIIGLSMESYRWNFKLLSSLLEDLDSHYIKKRDGEYDRIRNIIVKSIGKASRSEESTYDNIEEEEKSVSAKLSTGIHLVNNAAETMLYQEDSFSVPVEIKGRSQSNPLMGKENVSKQLDKRCSAPITSNDCGLLLRAASVENVHSDVLHRAQMILKSKSIDEPDALRTLLQLDNREDNINFNTTITVSNVARSLAEIAVAEPVNVPSLLSSGRSSHGLKTKSSGAVIVKPIRPKKAVATYSSSSSDSSSPHSSPLQVPSFDEIMEEPIEKNSNCLQNKPVLPRESSDEENNAETSLLAVNWIECRLKNIVKEDGIVVSPEEVSSTTAEVMPSKSYKGCPNCKLHRTWKCLALLVPVVRKVSIEQDLFADGGVPVNSIQWNTIFSYYFFNKDDGCICPSCEEVMTFVKKALKDTNKFIALTPDTAKVSVENIQQRIRESNQERLHKILFSSKSEEENISAKATESKNSNSFVENDSVSTDFDRLLFRWLRSIDVVTLLVLCCQCIGYKLLLSVLKSSGVSSLLSEADWAALVQLSTREEQRGRDIIDSKSIKEVITQFDLTDVIVYDSPSVVASPQKKFQRRASSPIMYSWTIDSNGLCPICTLALRAQIPNKEVNITTFQCGHCYHADCLSGRFFCLVCRSSARRPPAVKTVRT